MKEITVICPNCGAAMKFKNWFHWVLHTPFHWFGKRLTKCEICGKRAYMKRERTVGNLKTFYCIVPQADKCTYLAFNENNLIIYARKEDDLNTSLIFATAVEAHKFISEYLEDNKHFKVEKIYLNPKFYQI